MLKNVIKKIKKSDNLGLLIQAANGVQYVVARKRFDTKLGNVAYRRIWETPTKAAKRMLAFLGEAPLWPREYEIIRSHGLGQCSCFVVWFPHAHDFDPQDEKWAGCLFLADEAKEKTTKTQQRILEVIYQKALNLHEAKLSQQAA